MYLYYKYIRSTGDKIIMDKLIQIFVQLGVDGSIFYQFAIFMVVFFVLKVVFFNKLLFVLQARESKTVKLEEGASDKFKEAQKLAKELEHLVVTANEEIHEKMTAKKASAIKAIEVTQKESTEQIMKSFEEKKADVIASIEANKAEILATADELSEKFVDKITN